MNYHDKIILELELNQEMLGVHLGLLDLQIRTNVNIGNGDIDLLIKGNNYQGKEVEVVAEVKGHSGLTAHYLRKQLPKYRETFPSAQQWLITGSQEQELDISKFEFQNYS